MKPLNYSKSKYILSKSATTEFIKDSPLFIRLIAFFAPANLKKVSWSIIRAVLIIGISYIIIYPLLLKLSVTFMHTDDLYDPTVIWIPKHLTLENLRVVYTFMEYPESFLNTVKVVVITTILQLASCTMVGYGFARFRIPAGKLFFSLVILTLLVPPQTIMVPLYFNFRGLNMIDTFWPFVFTSATCMGIRNGLYIYIIRQFFRNMPAEIEEAAMIDGAGVFKTFYKVMLPSAIPIMVSVGLFSLVWQWNDTFYVTMFWTNKRILASSLGSIFAEYQQFLTISQTGIIVNNVVHQMLDNIGTLMMIAPILIIYIFAQRHFVESIERSGIVG